MLSWKSVSKVVTRLSSFELGKSKIIEVLTERINSKIGFVKSKKNCDTLVMKMKKCLFDE